MLKGEMLLGDKGNHMLGMRTNMTENELGCFFIN